jgi:hypothetical protein
LILLLFASITAALLIAEKTGSVFTGFLYVTFFYFLLGIVLIAFRDKWIRFPMQNSIIKSFFDNGPKD